MQLITGGSGFLGRRLATALVGLGYRVRIFDLNPPTTLPAGAEFYRGDIRDERAVRDALEGVKVIHHLAALVPLAVRSREAYEVNTLATKLLGRAAGGRRMIFLSSSAIFGGSSLEGKIFPETEPSPIEVYGDSKLKAEESLRGLYGSSGDLAILRPRTILGPGRLGIFSLLFDWIIEGRRIYMIGNGEHLMQLVHVDDLIDFHLRIFLDEERGIFHIGGGMPISQRDLLEAVVKVAGSSSRLVPVPEWLGRGSLRLLHAMRLSPLAPWHYLALSRPLYFEPPNSLDGWEPKYSAEQALVSAFEEYRRGGKRPDESPHLRPLAAGILNLLRRIS